MNKTRIVGNELLKHGRNFFSLEQIVKATGIERNLVRDILLDFWRGKFLVRICKDVQHTWKKYHPFENPRYRIIKPSKLAERIAPKYRGENNSSDRIWFVIRKKRIFTRRDLCVLGGVSNEQVRWFTKMLARAGYIKQTTLGEWTLIKDTGPKRPYVGDQVRKKIMINDQ
jgi:hypothetical protein